MIPITKPYLGVEEIEAVQKPFETGWLTQGPLVKEFEQKFAEAVGAKYAICTTSCTTALFLSLRILGVDRGDEVICPSMSFIATANCIKHSGGVPVFADVEIESGNISIDSIKSLIGPRTKGVIIVHQLGMPANIDEIRSLCAENNIFLLEDSACALGSMYFGRRLCDSTDNISCYSLHPRKVITTGEGGVVTTNCKEVYERLSTLRQHGMNLSDLDRHGKGSISFEEYPEVGYNFRMTDIQAAVGIAQLEKLDFIVKTRREIAQYYNYRFAETDGVLTPIFDSDIYSNFQSYSIRLKSGGELRRNRMMSYLLKSGISSRRGVMAIHREIPYQDARRDDLEQTNLLTDSSILIPIFPGMSKRDMEYVANKTIEASMEVF
ncbi:DegT/DnrJ/EryC1/StrS family aminotransferase [Pseudobacteriovorax antillogorgiicola]|uniref:dTDP-4-amino-4,6-dideoxygalactose transaminase n=1 Tax=Pseudobacteriovorax antillogorgiicola TaxID=1513793 RepID=A0A1Y6CSB2_9BACT|nr:DegT/DnrJ/EryC1/StrS family aminotransferase [Pseudobacteriovorax antillogorgiicola]TCS45193.1 dTDP-4-amino-4,6-dideoxygalactose transaminase [Pseudobacteriovorax antillogorgiicola]SMF75610.1 dTDP-4-amino-4,6-dideoxygalactose transaminase [Pseudobacteriovorax antillogorgiicola]